MSPVIVIDWSDEVIGLLRKLAADGLSASQVAHALSLACPGATKNAMIGKARRLGIKWAYIQSNQPRGPAVRVGIHAPKRRPLRQIAQRQSKPPLIDPIWVKLADLREDACHFPRGDPKQADFRYCGATPISYRKYCAYHNSLAYQGRAAA
jgi:GcrA cell cycle regulator